MFVISIIIIIIVSIIIIIIIIVIIVIIIITYPDAVRPFFALSEKVRGDKR